MLPKSERISPAKVWIDPDADAVVVSEVEVPEEELVLGMEVAPVGELEVKSGCTELVAELDKLLVGRLEDVDEALDEFEK